MQYSGPQRLQDVTSDSGFPVHIAHILNPGKSMKCTEIVCRLIHVCMIETGFIPLINNEPALSLEIAEAISLKDSVPQLIKRLQGVIDEFGSLHNVVYKSIIDEKYELHLQSDHSDINSVNGSAPDPPMIQFSTNEIPSEKSEMEISKERGDGSNLATISQEDIGQGGEDLPSNVVTRWRKAYSENISVCTVHEGTEIFVVANGPNFHKNTQLSLLRYVRSSLPVSAKAEDFLKSTYFSAFLFADHVKRKFCYEIMDEMNGLSFEIRSLSWLPPEILVEIGKRCSLVSVLRLRSTCSEIHAALSANNQNLWKTLLKKDFPHCNLNNLKVEGQPDRYFRKYCEMYRFTFRPLRRGYGRNHAFVDYFGYL